MATYVEVKKGLKKMFSRNSLTSPAAPGSTRTGRGVERVKRQTLANIREVSSQSSSTTDASSSASTITSSQPATPSIAPTRVTSALQSRLQRKEKPKLTTSDLRELRELIRYRYMLDVEIWDQRHAPEWMREKPAEQMIQADAALVKLKQMVNGWDKRSNFSTDEEYEKFKEIRVAILAKGKRNWKKEPPWGTEDNDTQFAALQLSYVDN